MLILNEWATSGVFFFFLVIHNVGGYQVIF